MKIADLGLAELVEDGFDLNASATLGAISDFYRLYSGLAQFMQRFFNWHDQVRGAKDWSQMRIISKQLVSDVIDRHHDFPWREEMFFRDLK